MNNISKCFSLTAITVSLFFSSTVSFPLAVYATETSVNLPRKTYEFKDTSKYEIDTTERTSSTAPSITLGTVTLEGDINRTYQKDGYTAYEIADKSTLNINFKYDSTLKEADKTEWHLIEDTKNEVNGVKLDNKIKNGVLILQTSLDGVKWTKVASYENHSSNVTFDKNNGINDVQLINGCFYRIITAFEIGKTSPGQFNIFDVFNNSASYTEKIKCAEVYSFYAGYQDAVNNEIDGEYHKYETNKYLSKTKENDYSGSEKMDKNDPHYGWELGAFCISGYSDMDSDGSTYYKNVGDRTMLTFQLDPKFDLKKLDGKSNLQITNEKKGCDSIFGTKPHAMGHGELIIKHTKTTGESRIIEYSNFLEALASPSANTNIRLYEEGTYDVHLDYGITNSKSLNK